MYLEIAILRRVEILWCFGGGVFVEGKGRFSSLSYAVLFFFPFFFLVFCSLYERLPS